MSQPEPLTKDEQELLRLAAKAAGRVPDDIDGDGAWFRGPADPIVGAWTRWDPLRVDGHALQLAVRLRLLVEVSDDGHEARAASSTGHHYTNVINGDADAALRHAIVCCAAQVGGWQG